MVRERLFVTNCGEQFSPVSFGQPTLKAGYMEKVPTDNVQGVVCYGKLTGEIDEPAPDVVVYGMVSSKLMVTVCPRQRLVTWKGRCT